MPTFSVSPFDIDFTENARIIDTNLLYGYFYPRDKYHAEAYVYLEELSNSSIPLLIPVAVLVEVFGLLVGSLKQRQYWHDLVAWLEDPGNIIRIIPQECLTFDQTTSILKRKPKLDYVDALILSIGNDFTERCKMRTPIIVASLDYWELFECKQEYNYKVLIQDPITWEIYK